MSVEIEKVTPERQAMVFIVINDYCSAILRGSPEEIKKAWAALNRLQEADD